ncbi:hypothetical protein BD779DRAFT_1451485 [Infundibulicybe gibba]|nr:hypothetical protein BD779DRAFT_1453395 [Infundibulicybe gibba]KAF8873717.1 hypothetical protein BD779DRAFT_1451485 [Infundibulicybe gibba]
MTLLVDGRQHSYALRGIVYHGDNHFTARVVTVEGRVWYHDGMVTGRELVPEGILTSRIDLTSCQSRTAIVTVYARRVVNDLGN